MRLLFKSLRSYRVKSFGMSYTLILTGLILSKRWKLFEKGLGIVEGSARRAKAREGGEMWA